MAVTFLKQVLERFCSHRFSWPHSGIDGHDYQVCLICGTIYEYDWAMMRRTRRLTATLDRRVVIEKSRLGAPIKPI
jgi:hypothetical protein